MTSTMISSAVAFIKNVINAGRESSGHFPHSLSRALAEYPTIKVALATPEPCIRAHSVPAWHELGGYPVLSWPRRDRGQLTGWRKAGNRWESFQVQRPEYAAIGSREVIPSWTCDISDIHGFSSSKSRLDEFAHTDDMVETNSREMIDEITPEKLAKNLSHREIRIIHSKSTSDHFTRYLWDGRLWLMNSGGSHHTAAAKYIAARIGARVPLTGNLHLYSLNGSAVDRLRADFEMFVIDSEPEITNAFFDAMQAFGATWLWHTLPRPYESFRAILLPRNEGRSMRVAAALHEAQIMDMGKHLTELVARQISISSYSTGK